MSVSNRRAKLGRYTGSLALLLLLAASGCFSFEVEGDGDKTTRSARGREVVHGSFYGFEWGARDVIKCDAGLGIYRAEVHTNFLYVLASVASLGLYVPLSVEWWCQAPREEDDPDDVLELEPAPGGD